MDLVLLSDTHELHREVDIPLGDLLIHAGDWSMFDKSLNAIKDFASWFTSLPHRHKILVPGNHQFRLEQDPSVSRLFRGATLLIDQPVVIEGLNIYGSPVTPLYGGAYGMSSPADRVKHWANVPEDTDVLITHGPPYGILDQAPHVLHHGGDPELLEAVQRLQPRLHVFGHVHSAYGIQETGDTTFINCALLGGDGGIEHEPVRMRMLSPE